MRKVPREHVHRLIAYEVMAEEYARRQDPPIKYRIDVSTTAQRTLIFESLIPILSRTDWKRLLGEIERRVDTWDKETDRLSAKLA